MRIITLLLWLLLGGLYFYLWHSAQKTCCQPQDDDLSGLLYEVTPDCLMHQTLHSSIERSDFYSACTYQAGIVAEEVSKQL
jgi:hypothetical protein